MENRENILFSILFLIAIILLVTETIQNTLFLGILGSIATLYFGTLKYKIERDILFKELFKTVNDRYDSKLNDLINSLRNDEQREINDQERNLIIDYFNLCAEEYLWYKKKRLPQDVWKAWKAGILQNLTIRQVKKIYDLETNSANGEISYYGLVKELKK